MSVAPPQGASRFRDDDAAIAERLGVPSSSWTAFATLVDEVPGMPSRDAVEAAIRRRRGERVGRHRPARTISRDHWVDEDTLGTRIYADAIVEFIRHPQTLPPLTIGIKAEWGAGKTSLMRMIRKQLDPRPDDPLPEIPQDTRRPTVRDLLHGAKQPPPDRDESIIDAAEPDGAADLRPTVWFNAWKYQSADQVWAGLGYEIIRQLTGRMGVAERERFWARLNLARVDEQRVRSLVYRTLLDRILANRAAIVAGVVAVAAAIVAVAVPGAWSEAKATGLAAFAAGVLGFAGSVFRTTRAFLDEPASVTSAELVREPDYAGGLGYLHLVHSDLERVLGLVATDRRPVVVFVDDLDRCSWEVVTKVVEALNVFLAGDFPNCIFVLAMEPNVVAAHIESSYKNLQEAFDDGDDGAPPLGWRFLEKMVQLPMSLPAPEPEQLKAYVRALLNSEVEQPQLAAGLEAAVVETVTASDAPIDQVPELARRAAGDAERLHPELSRAVLRAIGDRFNDDNEEIRTLVLHHAQAFSDNPREIKRFVNVLRFYGYIQVARRLDGLAAPDLEQLAKLAVLTVRWPNLLDALAQPYDGDRLLTRLEGADWQAVLAAARISERVRAQLASARLREVIEAPPTVGAASRGFI